MASVCIDQCAPDPVCTSSRIRRVGVSAPAFCASTQAGTGVLPSPESSLASVNRDRWPPSRFCPREVPVEVVGLRYLFLLLATPSPWAGRPYPSGSEESLQDRPRRRSPQHPMSPARCRNLGCRCLPAGLGGRHLQVGEGSPSLCLLAKEECHQSETSLRLICTGLRSRAD